MALRSMRPSREVSGDRFHSCSGGLYRCERIGIERVPLLASQQGGVAEQSIKCREASADREAGVVFRLRTKPQRRSENHPGCVSFGGFATFSWDAATPCCDAREGNDHSVICSHLYCPEMPGQAASSFQASTDPRPVARSYPGSAT